MADFEAGDEQKCFIPKAPSRTKRARQAILHLCRNRDALTFGEIVYLSKFFALVRDLFNWAEDFMFKFYLPLVLGVVAAPSMMLAGVANDQSQLANQIALLSLCAGNTVGTLIWIHIAQLTRTYSLSRHVSLCSRTQPLFGT
jgi:hypothetical protein